MLTFTMPAFAEPMAPIHHRLRVTLEPEQHRLQVEDTVTIPSAWPKENPVRFALHSGLSPEVLTPGASIRAIDGMHYAITVPAKASQFELRYGGVIDDPLEEASGDQARGISSRGVFLNADSLWFPRFAEQELVSFELEIVLPEGWTAVSQGDRTGYEKKGAFVRWQEDQPQPDIYLLAGRFTEYTGSPAPIATFAFLLEPDADIAQRYLDATATYIDFFSRLLGDYPYRKFALVENFWETGYGMPSFTALGRTVIRLPFILQSSYPHEILHNWWGNGVYVDLSGGNWSEGLTAYVADHLLAEQRGEGAAMRRNNLQRYVDYVREAADFPLTEFRMRHNPATEAVGYGKAMMFFHMLRRELGDDRFVAGLRDFYREQCFRFASFDDLREALARHAGGDLRDEFAQWTARTGAPQLEADGAQARPLGGGDFELAFTLRQTQPGPAYSLRVPVAVTVDGVDQAFETTVPLTQARDDIHLTLKARPLRVDIDPDFDLFRRVDRLEVPPALSQAFGAERTMVVIPAASSPAMREAYRRLAEAWREDRGRGEYEVTTDSAIERLPDDRSVWLMGWDNRFRSMLETALPATIAKETVHLPEGDVPRTGHAVVVTARRANRPDLALTWLAAADPKMMPHLARKLPHYGQYSYAAFSGEAATNVIKGQWPVTDSPLGLAVRQADQTLRHVPPAKRAARQALSP